jgi:hypothetical protein
VGAGVGTGAAQAPSKTTSKSITPNNIAFLVFILSSFFIELYKSPAANKKGTSHHHIKKRFPCPYFIT